MKLLYGLYFGLAIAGYLIVYSLTALVDAAMAMTGGM